jgi:hypothetical protein
VLKPEGTSVDPVTARKYVPWIVDEVGSSDMVGLSEYTLNKETNAIIRGKRNIGKPSLEGKNMEGGLSGNHEEAASTSVYPPPV